ARLRGPTGIRRAPQAGNKVRMPKTKDYYEVLGVPRTATQKEISSAFRKLARKFHPDLNANDKQAEARFKELSEAHGVLSDAKKRKLYDEFGPNWAAAEAAGAQPGSSRGGGGFRPDAGSRVEYRTVTPEGKDGKDLRVMVPVPLHVALRGGEVSAPTIKGGQVKFTIPAETQNGTKIRLKGLGLPDPKGGPPGDMYAEVRVQLPVPMDERTRKWAAEQPI